jgi:pimeloyl-ACP methyl ester carboxylesterase
MRRTHRLALAAALGVSLSLATACGTRHPATSAPLATFALSRPTRVGYAPVNGLRMYYEIHGTAADGVPPLVLVHGGGSTIYTTFGQVLPALAERRLVIAVETRGHGHTADVDRPLTFEQDADDVAALVRQLGFERADFFGFSNGGNVVMQIGIRHRDIARKLVVASAFIANDGLYPEVRASFTHATVDDTPAALRSAYDSAAPDPTHLPVLAAKLMSRLTGFRDWSPEDVQSITAPTLIMIGDGDIVRPEHAVQMMRLLPHARLAIFPSTAHGEYLGEVSTAQHCADCPRAAVEMIARFLEAPMPATR